jgi:drug/metabolite transporter (DMT)-like permease
MKALLLSESHNSLYFWPGVIVSAIAILFFGWAVLVSGQDWVGQAIWGTLAAVFAAVLLALAARDSRRTLRPAS